MSRSTVRARRFVLPLCTLLGALALSAGPAGATTTPSQIWAVGSFTLPHIPHFSQTLVETVGGQSLEVVGSPNEQDTDNVLSAVAAVGPNDAWAVGNINGGRGTLIEHWDGAQWSITPRPNLSGPYGGTFLSSVAAVSADDVWAVGHNGGGLNSVAEHWDGTRWAVVPTIDVTPSQNAFGGVAAVASNDVWAVGSYATLDSIPRYRTLIQHWDGTRWHVVRSPNAHHGSVLSAVSAVSATDVWAVGHTLNANNIQDGTLIEHWDGTRWSVVASPSPGIAPGLGGVAAVSADDVWAVGGTTRPGGACASLVEHWDGSSWKVARTPDASCLADVAAGGANDVWTVGGGPLGVGGGSVMHWDGSSWHLVTDPDAGGLSGVAVVPS